MFSIRHNIIQIYDSVCGTDIILHNVPTFSLNDGIFCIIPSVPHNIVMNTNNVM